MSGDDRLSPNIRHLWCIHQNVILRWGVYTIFKYELPDCRTGIPGRLEWFVPGDVPERQEIIDWLQKELVGFKEEPITDDKVDYHFPGQTVEVSISFFSGIEPYLEREQVQEIVRTMTERLVQQMKQKVKDRQGAPPESEDSREDDILGPEGETPPV